MSQCPFCNNALESVFESSGPADLAICTSCFNPLHLSRESGSLQGRAIAGAPDTRQIAAPGSIAAALLEQVPAAMEQLPVLPELSQRILRLLKDPDFGMGELAAMIREDSVLALAIMKQANSVAFGGLQSIKDLNSACARLGMKTVANTVQMVANRNLFITGDARLKENMERLWRHTVATAHCASQIARLTLAPDQEALFLAGLVHDIGKIVLLEMVASPRSKILRNLEGNPELVREVLDGLHPLFGLLVCQAWRLPPEFRAAVFFHHKPELCPAADWLSFTHTVALSNTIARVEGYGMYPGNEEAFLASNPSAIYLGLSDMKLAALRVDFSDTLEALFEAVH